MPFFKKILIALGILSASATNSLTTDLAMKAASAAQQAVDTAKQVDGTVLDYSPASLKKVDQIILGLRKEGQKPEEIPGILYILGAYVGEVMVRHIPGATWSEPPKDAQNAGLNVMGVTTKNGTFWNPIGKVHKLLMNGEEDSVAFLFEAVKSQNR